jgi:Kef-type K+ transport system membrane component KefB
MIDESFIRNLGIIVVAAALFARLARALSLPTIVGYLLAGLLLGPATGWVEVTQTFSLLSETGIVLLLFLVGLELHVDKIKEVGPLAMKLGLAQVFLTAGGGWLLSLFLGFPVRESLFLGVVLTFSSTVVVVKMLSDRGEFDSLHGRVAVGVLLVQDLVVIILLTVAVGLAAGDPAQRNWTDMAWNLARALGGMVLLLCSVLAASRYLLSRPLAWAANSAETLFIWSLCWCFGIVAAAHALRLSHETGAFLAGVSLAQSPYSQELRRRVHPLMNFFIAVFFVTLGIAMKPGVAIQVWPQALALCIFVMVGKFLIIMGMGSFLKLSEGAIWRAATSLTQISEFSFILAAMAAKAGLAGQQAIASVGIVGLVTITISSCLMQYMDQSYIWVKKRGLLRMFRARDEAGPDLPTGASYRDHVIVVGMNSLGRELARRLTAQGQSVLAIDVDPGKLRSLPCPTLHGNAEEPEVLEAACAHHARLLVSALHIADTNDLLAYRCHKAGLPCSIHATDMEEMDHLLAMNVTYLMIPKVDGIKRQNQKLREMRLLPES